MVISIPSRLLMLLFFIVTLVGLLTRYADLEDRFQANLGLLDSTGWSMIKTVEAGNHEAILLPATTCRPQADKNDQPQTKPEDVRDPADGNSCYALLQSRLVCLQGQSETAEAWLHLARETCARQEQTDDWAGALAWAGSNRQEAIQFWLQIKHGKTMMMHRAQQLIRAGYFEESQLLLEAALPEAGEQARQGHLAQAYENLGLAYQRQSNWSQAIEAYREALRWDPERASTFILLAITYRNNHQWNDAHTAFQQALDLVPETDHRQRSIIFEQIGIMQQEQRTYDQAYVTLSEAFCLRKHLPESTNDELRPLLNRLERLQKQTNGRDAAISSVISCPIREE
jgi:tetratricopeptide (TPR) repeat protein